MSTDTEAIRVMWSKLHSGVQISGDEISLLISEHGKEIASYHKALDERWAEIVALRSEVERLRGVVEAAEGAVDDWDNRPALDRLNTSAFMRLRGALAALEAGDG